MKLFLLLSMLLAQYVHAAPSEADKTEMMKKFKEYSTPSTAHKKLAELAGKWTYTSRMWEDPHGTPTEARGKSSMKMILGGRFLQQEVSGTAMGQPFTGLGFVGYDNIKQTYSTVWLDDMATGVMVGKGSFDEGSKTLTDSGEFTCPMSPTKTGQFRNDWKMIDKNNMVFTIYGTIDEKQGEFKMMELIYKRSK